MRRARLSRRANVSAETFSGNREWAFCPQAGVQSRPRESALPVGLLAISARASSVAVPRGGLLVNADRDGVARRKGLLDRLVEQFLDVSRVPGRSVDRAVSRCHGSHVRRPGSVLVPTANVTPISIR